jgi:hypothetical protein
LLQPILAKAEKQELDLPFPESANKPDSVCVAAMTADLKGHRAVTTTAESRTHAGRGPQAEPSRFAGRRCAKRLGRWKLLTVVMPGRASCTEQELLRPTGGLAECPAGHQWCLQVGKLCRNRGSPLKRWRQISGAHMGPGILLVSLHAPGLVDTGEHVELLPSNGEPSSPTEHCSVPA